MWKINEKIESAWKSPPVTALILVISGCTAIWALCFSHTPGVSIGILGFVAALMSLRADMHGLEKAAWITIITILLVAEVRSIRSNNQLSSDERKEQIDKLKSLNDDERQILKNLQTEISTSREQFMGIAEQLNLDLKTERRILGQTRPRALIVSEPPGIFWKTVGGRPVSANLIVTYANQGDGIATNINVFGKIYAADARQDMASQMLIPNFEEAWSEHLTKTSSGRFLVKGTSRSLHFNQGGFTDDEFAKVNSGTYMIYQLVRFRYTDITGTWFTDECLVWTGEETFVEGRGTGRGCTFFTDPHYPAKR